MTARELHALPDAEQLASKGLSVGATHFDFSQTLEGTVRLYAFKGSRVDGLTATSTLLQEMSPAQARELALGLDQVADATERANQ